MDNIPEVANSPPSINTAEFVKLTIYNEYGNLANVTIHTFSSAYKAETIAGTVYLPLGGLLAVGTQPRDLRVTSADTSISLSGVSGNNIPIVLGTKIKGSKIEILRGFYNNNYVLTNSYPRFTGIVTSYAITEDLEATFNDPTDNFTISVNASSYKTILENRIAGRKTNKSSWQVFNSTDSSMNNVYSIADQPFDFGMDPKKKATTSSAATGFGGGSFGPGGGGRDFGGFNVNEN
jgi:hypothetical protein